MVYFKNNPWIVKLKKFIYFRGFIFLIITTLGLIVFYYYNLFDTIHFDSNDENDNKNSNIIKDSEKKIQF